MRVIGAAASDQEGYATCAGVRLYYRTRGPRAVAGPAPLAILLHGFPDDHRTWAPLDDALGHRCQVVTPDLRGYCNSDKPAGVDAYRMEKLVADVIGLIDHFGRERAVLIGHDWGAAIAQNVARLAPQRVERLVLLNMPHLSGLMRELAHNPRQQAASAYARTFQDLMPSAPIDLATLVRQVRGLRSPARALDVLRRSDVTALLNYYRANYPRPPYRYLEPSPRDVIFTPTLILFGLEDPYVLADSLNDNWRWFAEPLTLITIPRAGHWVHHDAPDVVARAIQAFLLPSPDG